jgi:hypothetical protein
MALFFCWINLIFSQDVHIKYFPLCIRASGISLQDLPAFARLTKIVELQQNQELGKVVGITLLALSLDIMLNTCVVTRFYLAISLQQDLLLTELN